jgi:class 3 adenylate cyclase/tetratricopeptide (TPR) repeat protein
VSLVCANCRTDNPAGAKFCTECASPLARACANCGTANPAGAKFCGECAAPLSAGDAAPTAAAGGAAPAATGGSTHEAERRLVSVLFADLVGFTPFAEERDAEDVRESLSRYFEIARQVIERYGGTVEKFIGDAVMAVWGVPTTHEDDAERAVRAALDLLDAVRALGPGIEARAGVLTGEAAVTMGATDQGMVAGDLVNTASRLQGAAAPGTVLVGEATQRAASAGIMFEPAGEQALKGKSAPVPAWRAIRIVGGVKGRWRSDGPEAPFIGRNEELTLLKDLYHATAREKRARLVSVVGPAGIGKSRLAREFLNHVDAEAEDFWLHHGRSPAYGEGLSFWALGEMIRQRAGLAETDDEATTRAGIRKMLADNVPDEPDRKWIEPAMVSLLGLDGGASETDQLFGAWRSFFEILANDVPVVLVFEDLHWADSGMLDFIDYLLEWSRSQPIFILTLARPELLEKRSTWGAGKRQFTSVYLEPLPEPAIRELLTGLVPGLPDQAARAISARADGVPLYAVETVRMLVAEGRIVESGGVYAPVGDLSTLAVPESLTALIASRLDALDPEVRGLAQDASVLGQRFTVAGLAAVSGLDSATLTPRLEVLVRRELLAMETDPRSPERNQYGFVQSLIREVTYNTLARRDRKARHLAAARFFETLETDELAGGLAGQYLAAHANAEGPEETAALAAQARVALRAAADRALALGGTEQAFEFLRQALALALDPSDAADLALRAGEAATSAGRHQDGEQLLRRAAEQFAAAGDQDGSDRALTGLGTAMNNGSRFTDAIELLEPALANVDDFSSRPGLIAAGGQLARALMLQYTDFDRAVEAADRVLPAAERADMGSLVADLLVTKGTAMTMGGRGREGLALIQAGGSIAESLGATGVAVRSLINQSGQLGWSSPREVLEGSQQGLAEARRIGHRAFMLTLLANGCEIAMMMGDWAWAESELARLLDEELESADRLFAVCMVTAYRALGGRPRAELLEEIERADVSEAAVRAQVDTTMGLDAASEGRLEESLKRYRSAQKEVAYPGDYMWLLHVGTWLRDAPTIRTILDHMREGAHHGPVVDCLTVGGNAAIAALEGRAAEALTLYQRARAVRRELGLRFEEALLGVDMATVLDTTLPEVAEAIEQSRTVLAELGAKPFLARLETAARGTGESASGNGSSAEAIPVAETEVAAG